MLSRTILAGAAAIALAVTASAPAYALCTLCNSTVRLDDNLASCFVARANDELQKLATSGKDFVIIDLKDCATRALPTAVPDANRLVLDTEFAADAQGLQCLSAKINAMPDDALLPSHLFDLTKDCPAN